MITVKRSSTNYLLWRHQVETLLQFEDLCGYLDSSIPPLPHDSSDASSAQDVNDWITQDRCLHILLLSSLSEEAMSETLVAKLLRMFVLPLKRHMLFSLKSVKLN
ncbi:unnamed protein product [Cuscuta epithymum]|uniref:Retrotransposon Copia-like N-terminal domain-containing protein n=1 Tax=Cuscuta epithymum TaxID=186058 RepID=A0AAV0EA20_9ASTE|nr:unnamed protein product [Cuscuta epithymum]